MRISERIKQPIFYAKYLGKEEILETVGNESIRTGDYDLSYGEVQTARVFLSAPKGEARVEGDGVTEHYRHTIVSEKDLGLTTEDLVFVGVDSYEGGVFDPWLEGEHLDGGVFQPWSHGKLINGGIFGDTKAFQLYQIRSVIPSFHHFTYEVEEI